MSAVQALRMLGDDIEDAQQRVRTATTRRERRDARRLLAELRQRARVLRAQARSVWQ